jgi:uncharacterized protein YlxP (DUF503 family)
MPCGTWPSTMPVCQFQHQRNSIAIIIGNILLSSQSPVLMKIIVGLLTLHLQFDHIISFKDKRHTIKPMINRLHRQFNISIAEVDHQDIWNSAALAVVFVSNDTTHVVQTMQNIVKFLQENFPNISQMDEKLEIL